MNGYSPVPPDLWDEVRAYFAALIAPCKTCLRGNPTQCWHPECPSFRVRDLARRIESVSNHGKVDIPNHVRIEDEILDILRRYGRPVYPSMVILSSTNSKVSKCQAIDRLVKQGRVVEERINDYTRKISLPTTKES